MAFKDVVVVLPGISGSVLEKDGKEIWGTSTGAIWRAVTTGGDSINSLALGQVDDPQMDDLGDGVKATRLIPDLHLVPGLWKIDGYSGLMKRLQTALGLEPGRNLFGFAYDWRRDNRVSARRLQKDARGWLKSWRERSGNGQARLVLVGHSMGGLVARYFLEVLGGVAGLRRPDYLRHALSGIAQCHWLSGERIRQEDRAAQCRSIRNSSLIHGGLSAPARFRMRGHRRRQP
jgi:hypothetical protein